MQPTNNYIHDIEDLSLSSVLRAGGKAAALGEIHNSIPEVKIPKGFIITTDVYNEFIETTGLSNRIQTLLSHIEKDDILSLQYFSKQIRALIETTDIPLNIRKDITEAYRNFGFSKTYEYVPVAVRSSATSEDQPLASFAGMHDSFLQISTPQELLYAYRKCCGSLFTERAIQYRANNGLEQHGHSMAVLVQEMVNTDPGYSGVAFTIDIETGFENGIVVNAVYGLGIGLVQGSTIPDEYLLFKPALEKGKFPILSRKIGMKDLKYVWSADLGSVIAVHTSDQELQSFALTDKIIKLLGQYCLAIERHFSAVSGKFAPMDIEWAVDNSETLWIVQARPLASYSPPKPLIHTYKLKERSKVLATGTAIGRKIGQGSTSILLSPEQMVEFKRGDVLVTDLTDPAWMPIMKKASAIVTNKGGRTSHAALVSRELGVPCIVGANNATDVLRPGQSVTISCIDGDVGKVYDGLLDIEVSETAIDKSATRTKIMFITGLPDAALAASHLPSDGVAMGREEFIIYSEIGIHPIAFIRYEEMKRDLETLMDMEQKYGIEGVDRLSEVIEAVERLSKGYKDKVEFFVEKLAEGMAKIAASVYPKETYMKLCDFKSNEFRALKGGFLFEPLDINPMIGWRSAVRYYSEKYQPIFQLECRAFMRAREQMGFSNMHIMIPFCRSVQEGRRVIEALRQNGIVQHKDGLLITAEIEVPSSVIEAVEFSTIFDMFIIGANDLTQMVLGTDRDSELLAHIFDERDPAVLKFIKEAIDKIHSVPPKIIEGREVKVLIGLAGSAVSNYPEFAHFLVAHGIDFIALDPSPEGFLTMRRHILEIERKIGLSEH